MNLLWKEREDLTGMRCAAVFSADEAYRYRLQWIWDCSKPMLVAWMLNPSTATHEVLDPTIAGLVKRARAWGYGGVYVVNLFALRATDPRVMLAHAEPVGEANDRMIEQVLAFAKNGNATVIAAWGKHGRHRGREAEAMALAKRVGAKLHYLKLNGDGTPAHPLYLPHALLPTEWTI